MHGGALHVALGLRRRRGRPRTVRDERCRGARLRVRLAEAEVELLGAADVDVGVLVDVGEEVVERALDRVGEHERAGQEGDADDDRERGEDEPALARQRRSCRLSLSMAQSPKRFMRSSTASARRVEASRRRCLPSARNTTRSAYDAAVGSWVTITIVWPSSLTALRMNSRISAPARLSRLPVGSSAKMISGRRGQGAGHGDALLLAARQLARAVRQAVAQPDGVDHAVDPRLVGLAAGEGDRERDVLVGVERRDQVEGLEDEADLVAPQDRELACR